MMIANAGMAVTTEMDMADATGRTIGAIAASLWAAALGASGLAAQAPAPPDIVVTAREAAAPAAVHRQAIAITRMDDDPYRMPLAQYQEPLCPGIMGMARDNASFMIDRLRFVAARAGMRVAKDGCSPNLLVIVTRDVRATIAELVRRRGHLFAQMNAPEIDALIADPGPVRAWTITSVRTRDGLALIGGQGANSANATPVLQMWAAHSKIYLTNRLDIQSAVVMIDLAAIEGRPVVQIADYVAMRGLARTRPARGDAAVGTILSLFEPGAQPPLELTAFDLAYLQSVYGSPPNLPAVAKLGAVPAALRRADQAGAQGGAQAGEAPAR